MLSCNIWWRRCFAFYTVFDLMAAALFEDVNLYICILMWMVNWHSRRARHVWAVWVASVDWTPVRCQDDGDAGVERTRSSLALALALTHTASTQHRHAHAHTVAPHKSVVLLMRMLWSKHNAKGKIGVEQEGDGANKFDRIIVDREMQAVWKTGSFNRSSFFLYSFVDRTMPFSSSLVSLRKANVAKGKMHSPSRIVNPFAHSLSFSASQ